MVDLTSGTILAERYRVVRVLGQGGMGVVLEVVHAQLGGRFALKLMHAEHASDAEMLARFENEARLAANLVSEHLVRVTDLGRLPTGEPFLVMDYLDGLDLDQIIEQKRSVSVPEAVQWVVEASAGLAHLHAAGSVHRDVKPSNLFLANDPSGRQVVKVLDFGLARAPRSENTRLTATTANFGTPLYMAPEQILSAKHVDARADQHALAHVLYELLTGEPAFGGETAGAVTVAIATQPAPPVRAKRPDAPEGVEQAVARAMSKRPEDRFPSLGEFAMALAVFSGPNAQRCAADTLRLVGRTDVEEIAHARTALSNPRPALSAPGIDATEVRPPSLSVGPVSTSNSKGRRKQSSPLVSGLAIATAAVVGIGLAVGYARWGEGRTGTSPTGSVADASDTAKVVPSETSSQPDTKPTPPSPTPAVTPSLPLETSASAATSVSLPKTGKPLAPARASAPPSVVEVNPKPPAVESPPPPTKKPRDPLSEYK